MDFKLVAADLGGNDPIFGRLTRLRMHDFIDPGKLAALAGERASWTGLTVLYGPGALPWQPTLRRHWAAWRRASF